MDIVIEQKFCLNSATYYFANRNVGTLLLLSSRFCVGTPDYCFGCWLDWIWIRFGHAATCQSMAVQLLVSSTPPAWTVDTIHVAPCKSHVYHTAFVLCFNSDGVEVPSLLLQPVHRSLKERWDVESLNQVACALCSWQVNIGADWRDCLKGTYRLLIATRFSSIYIYIYMFPV